MLRKLALLLSLTGLGLIFSAQVPRSRADIGPTANPTSGSATLDYLAVGTLDAGSVLNTSTASLGNGCLTAGSSAVAVNCTATTSTNNTFTLGANATVNGNAGFISIGAGSAASPQLRIATDIDTGLYSVGVNQLSVSTAGARSFNFSATAGVLEGVNSTSKLYLNDNTGSQLQYGGGYLTVGNTSVNISGNVNTFSITGVPVLVATTPTISSGFGTTPSVTAGKAYAFRVNVGTGGVATTGVIALGATATTGWNCTCTDITTHVGTCQQTASTTTTASFGQFVSAGTAQAWAASDILAISCVGF